MEHEELGQQDRASVLEAIKQKISLLPEKPGCYLMKNDEGTIIYVGKAKVLRNRVRSYFTGSHDGKTARLVQEIVDFEYIVTANNSEALVLECNLIKQHHPRYNVLLKDDKTYPYIKITGDEHPRLEVTRRVVKDRGKYFGPYPNAYAAQETKKLLDRMYPLRKCRTLPDKVCLYYHIGQCVAPCEVEVAPSEYERMVGEISKFLNGGAEKIKAELAEQMMAAAESLEFEKAKELRDLIAHLDTVMIRQNMTSAEGQDRDVFGFAVEKGWMCVQILYVRQGKMIERNTSTFPYYGEAYEDFISFVTQYYSENPALPKEVCLPLAEKEDGPEEDSGIELQEALESWLKVKLSYPQRGAKKQLVEMAVNNARIALAEKFRLAERDAQRSVQAAAALGEVLGLPKLARIEAFDNSNIQGSDPVAAMVVFTEGKPDRKEYRKYKIKTVQGPDDYESMREVVRRRYERVLKEKLPMPDLIIVDGGKGQIAAALDVLENELGLQVPIAGLSKDEKHKTAQLLAGDPPEIIALPRDSNEFYLLQRIQEEVHRFAITFHRQTRTKSMIASELDSIPGIGEKRRKALLKHFGSLKKIKEAEVEHFKPLGIGEKLARQILDHLLPSAEPSVEEVDQEEADELM